MPFLDEIVTKLQTAGVGTLNTNIFIGAKASIPSDSGPYLSIAETGGSGQMRTQNEVVAYQRPTAQIVARASTYPVARAKAKQAYDVLNGLQNITLSGTWYVKIDARQEPTDIGLDDKDRPRVSFNIEALKAAS